MNQSNALAKLIDTNAKITRSELIDLVMEEMSNELEKELEASEKRLRELEAVQFSFDDVKSYLAKSKFRVNVDDTYCYGNEKPRHTLGFARSDDGVSVSAKDPLFGAHIREFMEVSERVSNLRSQRYQMENKKRAFKATITKKILEGTKEGRSLLDQLGNLKTHVRKQLGIGK